MPGEAILLANAKVKTLDVENAIAESILIGDGRIIAVGDEVAVAANTPATARRVDLDGRTVLPGLIDAHTHLDWAVVERIALRGITRLPIEKGELRKLLDGSRK
jgi:predicted amidohydrolase YtcJ